MTQKTFTLQPFSPPLTLAQVSLNGIATLQQSQLTILYTLSDPLGQVKIPSPTPDKTRQDNLWQHSCFELFVASADTAQYWEFNCSPAGHWNVYRFEGYRQGMATELAFTALPFQVTQTPSTLSLELTFSLKELALTAQPLHLSITAVLESQQDELSYWALTHPGPEADFHRRDSFILAFPHV